MSNFSPGIRQLAPAAGVPALKAAGVAHPLTAVGCCLGLTNSPVLCLQESPCHPDIYMLPGQKLVQGALSVGIEGGVEPALRESSSPVVEVEVLMPGVELAAQFPRSVDGLAQASVAARQNGFKLAGLRVLPGELGS